MFKKLLILLAFSLSLAAFSLDINSANASFTAFKTPDKIAVKGKLLKGIYKFKKKSGSISELLTGANASFLASNIDLANELKNTNLAKFFTALLKDKNIKVFFKKITEGKNKGTILARIKINKVNQNVPLQYEILDNKLKITGLIDLDDFKAEDALKSLSENIPEHLKLSWSQVELSFEIALK